MPQNLRIMDPAEEAQNCDEGVALEELGAKPHIWALRVGPWSGRSGYASRQ